MKKAIVLSGGGAKGAYQIGVWKALRKLNYKYDIVTGTSVGALNGAFMVMNDYKNALNFWKNISPKDIFDEQLTQDAETLDEKKEILLKYAKKAVKGGFSVQALEKNIERLLDTSIFFSSPINYGLVTFNLTNLKPLELEKKNLTKENLKDYLIASATCFPAFQIKKIDNEQYIDGGYYDNVPINLAIRLGAEEIVAVDLDAIGMKQKIKKESVKIIHIRPKNNLGSFLIFNKKYALRAIQYGYNDTMKTFGKYTGNRYTFKKSRFINYYQLYSKKFTELLLKIVETKESFLFEQIFETFNVSKIKKENQYEKAIDIIEEIATIFELDDVMIYRFSKFNSLLKKKIQAMDLVDNQKIEKLLEKNWKQVFDKKIIIKYMYDKIKSENYENLKKIAILFKKEFIAALYLAIL